MKSCRGSYQKMSHTNSNILLLGNNEQAGALMYDEGKKLTHLGKFG